MAPARPLRIKTFAGFMPAISAMFVALLAIGVLAGWAFDIEFLKSLLHPNRIGMNPMTAVLMLLSAVGLWMLREESPARPVRVAAAAIFAIVLVAALLRIFDLLGLIAFSIDQVLFKSRLEGNTMSPNT